MGVFYKGIYLPVLDETGWDDELNASLTILADAHFTARSLWLGVADVSVESTITVTNFGTAPDIVQMAALDNATTEGVYFTFRCPADWKTATFVLRPVWAPDATDAVAHTVRWSMNVKSLVGADVRAAGTTVAWTGDSSVHTIGVGYRETGQASTGFTPAAGDLVRVSLRRVGADGADTYTQIVNLLGVQVDYTAF